MAVPTPNRASSAFTHWWPWALAGSAGLLALFTPWAFLVEVALLAVAIYRLTRKPTQGEAIALVSAVVILAFVLAVLVAIGIATYFFQGTTHGNSVPLP